jgi:ribonuclease J
VVSGPDLISRGFVHQQTSDVLLESARQQVLTTIDGKAQNGSVEWQVIKGSIRDSLSRFLYEQMRRRPMIIPIVVEV